MPLPDCYFEKIEVPEPRWYNGPLGIVCGACGVVVYFAGIIALFAFLTGIVEL